MNQVATITSKMQLTMPINIAKKLGLKPGQKVFVSEHNGQATVTPIASLIEKLAGSLEIPERWKGNSIDHIIEQARAAHFAKKQ